MKKNSACSYQNELKFIEPQPRSGCFKFALTLSLTFLGCVLIKDDAKYSHWLKNCSSPHLDLINIFEFF